MKDKVDRALKLASEQILRDGELFPMFVAEDYKGQVFIVCTPWSGEEDKLKILDFLRIMFMCEGIVNYVFTSEIWFRSVSGKEAADHIAAKKAVSEYSDKEEAITCFGVDSNGVQASGGKLILRDKDGKVEKLADMLSLAAQPKLEGRMLSLLTKEKRPIPDEFREVLREMWRKLAKEVT